VLRTRDGRRFVLKIANGTEDRGLLQAQNAAMAHVAARAGICPRVVPDAAGAEIAEYRGAQGEPHFVRLLTWIDGEPLGAIRHRSTPLLRDLGRRVGQMDAALASFDHPAAHRVFHWDLARGFSAVSAHLGLVAGDAIRTLVDEAAVATARELEPLLTGLGRSVIHGDANDYNVIVSEAEGVWERRRRIAGFIDFGDMVHSYTAGDLAVAAAYAMLDAPDPLSVARAIVAGYHEARPLGEAELAAVFPLAKLRLCMSVCLAAFQQQQRPGDDYLAISQGPIARTLPRLAAMPPAFVTASLRHACGLVPSPCASRIAASLPGRDCAPVVQVGEGRAVVLDLSVGSALLSGDGDQNAEPALTPRIERAMREQGAALGVGRYNEPRLLYASALFDGRGVDERRTIHLGVDLFAPPGTPVHAPMDGVVHIAADNQAALDYGPVIVLRHETPAGEPFFTLYGHVSRRSLHACPPGRPVAIGDAFAEIGDASVNGGWTPHLHFQVITDLLDLGRDFPGVCRASERAVWTALSPDPSPVLGLGNVAFPDEAIGIECVRAARHARIGPNLTLGYREPVKIVRGWKQFLYDASGRRYLDAYNNVPHVGHCHPRVAAAAADQMRVLNTNTRYLHDSLGAYAERLAATLPEPLRICFFVNSGSEANELALRLARAHTRARDVIVLEAAYHGNTTSLIAISPYKFYGPGGEGARPWVHVAPVPDLYRGAYKNGDPHAAAKYASVVSEIVRALQAEERGVCAFIAESCPSVAGQIMLPTGYLAQVYRAVREAGGLCIADEVQTAYGRVGSHFYAFEALEVVPDIVVLGKPIGNGYPLGAVVTTPEVAASFDNGMEFFSTFGGSTVSSVVGATVLDVVLGEALQAHARKVGERLLGGLREVASRHPLAGDVRGSGLFIGVELVRDPDTLEPAADEAGYVVNRLREEGILLGTDGPFHNVIKIRPPMPFDAHDADRLVETLDRVLGELR
jgi:4-aminobutyrate aminotransferase-like enzyme/Ser/Thr protein kinase RdoA (MazF antagonist)/murein DD-endopeptidase MepM/ murein hydrolase activator NlpD